jgi:uncharacterized protein
MRMISSLLVAAVLMPAAAQAQVSADQPRTINVGATGTVEREPDRAMILLAVESQAPTAREASQQNAQLMDRVLAALRQAGIRDEAIRTVSYELRPEYSRPERDREPPRIASYRTINMVQVRVDAIARVGTVIDAALGAGANRVANLNFELQDAEGARLEALQMAMTTARREAEVIATAAGQRLGEPLSINIGQHYPPPRPMAAAPRMEMAMAADVPTPIEGGQLAVMASVHVVYRILDP